MADSDLEVQALRTENTQLRRAVDELSILNELANAIAASRDVEDIIKNITKRCLSAVRAEQGVVTLVGQFESDPTMTLVRTITGSGEAEALRPDQSLLGWMHLNKRPLLINEPRADDRFRGVKWPDIVRSILCVPLIAQSRLIGILTLYNKKRSEAGFTPSDQRLIAILASQSAQVVEGARLYEEEKVLLAMRQEVELAHEIQANLLPSAPPVVPGYEFGGLSVPAKEVGGDYFDYIDMLDGRLGLTVGDVSGKGVGAALLMASSQATLRGQVVGGDDPASSLGRTNQLLCQVARKGTFVTLFLAMLEPATGLVSYANAGHNKPFVVLADGTIEILTLGGFVLGFLPSFQYQAAERVLSPGETLVIYSDGVTEAMNSASEQFDEERLYTLAKRYHRDGAPALVDRILNHVRAFAGEREQSDDITILVVRRPD
ncbi:MAG: sigma-B regulation protein RsbU (phosphoserine phosphatase) [Rhodothermales bacterium]|jgi:sigma-B regulation protein RsbU (phosphoserine phosphatase)